MIRGTTTSIRLPPKLREQLEKTSQKLHRGKNWIVIKALEEYFDNINHYKLIDEARRQSILASQAEKNNDDNWHENMDSDGWI